MANKSNSGRGRSSSGRRSSGDDGAKRTWSQRTSHNDDSTNDKPAKKGDGGEGGFEKKPYNREDKRTSFSREKKSYGDRGDKKPFFKKEEGSETQSGERKPYGDRSESRARKPYADRGENTERKPYGDRSESRERKPYADRGENKDRKPYGDRSESRERKPYADRGENKDRKPYGDRSESSERKPYADRGENKERKPYGDRSESRERKPYGDRSESRERKPYGDRGENKERKPYGDPSESRERKPYADRGENKERKPYGDRIESRERKPFRDKTEDQDTSGSNIEGADNFRKDTPDSFEKRGFDRKKYEGTNRSFEKRNDAGKKSRPSNGLGYIRKPLKKRSDDSSTYVKREAPIVRYPDGTVREEKLTRLNKYIANSGICSRREADDLIKAGLVSVNGEIVTEMGLKISRTDLVKYNNVSIRKERKVYVLLNKPKDYITTTDDPGERKTVMALVENACKERIYPVGRLDRNTTGLLLVTNDGELTKKLTHPSSNVKKIYHVELDKNLSSADLKKITAGIELEDGMIKVDEINYDGDGLDKSQVGVALHSGKNRIVRRIFESLGYEVKKLDRVIFAGLTKKDLPRGKFRNLSEIEVNMLKMIAGTR